MASYSLHLAIEELYKLYAEIKVIHDEYYDADELVRYLKAEGVQEALDCVDKRLNELVKQEGASKDHHD